MFLSQHDLFDSSQFFPRVSLGGAFPPGVAKRAQRRRQHYLQSVRDLAPSLRDRDDAELLQQSDQLRAAVTRRAAGSDGFVEGCALMCEALRRTLAVELYDEQLLAAAAMLGGSVVEMQTGEGKTFACAPVAYLRALTGRGVHMVTPNSYLAGRDCQLLRPAFQSLGLSVGLLPECSEPVEKHAAYRCDITYGTAYEFGFDYLRDQFALRSAAGLQLGQRIWRLLHGDDDAQVLVVQRGLSCAIIDEIDNVLLDDAVSPLVLSIAPTGEGPDAAVHLAARSVIFLLSPGEHYTIDSWSQRSRLTPAGQRRVHESDINVPIDQLLRTWSEYVEQALHAEFMMSRDAHYIVDGQEVRIVDGSTGRIFEDRSWRDGLHQAVEAKEGLPITAEKQSVAQITRQRFFRLYESLCGTTGTATGCESEFRHAYRLRVTPIPLRHPCRRASWPLRSFANEDCKFTAILGSLRELHASGRPVLVGTKRILDSERLAQLCQHAGIPFQLLNGRQDADEASIIACAGEMRAVTIATNLAGRGTDIRLGPGVADRGGLHVIVADCHESARITRQLIGRCGRQGDPGSSQVFISADDPVIQRYAPWLVAMVRRYSQSNGEMAQDVSSAIRRIQLAAEHADYAARCALMRRDHSRTSLFAPDPT